MMSPLAHTLLCAIRYAHGRSQHPYEDVIQTVRDLWSRLDPDSRQYWLTLVEAQVPSDLERMIETHNGKLFPVTREELELERDAYLRLFRWCRDNIDLNTSAEILGRFLEALHLATRTINVLEDAGIFFVKQLVAQTEAELASIQGLGPIALEDIQRGLRAAGLSLGMQRPETDR